MQEFSGPGSLFRVIREIRGQLFSVALCPCDLREEAAREFPERPFLFKISSPHGGLVWLIMWTFRRRLRRRIWILNAQNSKWSITN